MRRCHMDLHQRADLSSRWSEVGMQGQRIWTVLKTALPDSQESRRLSSRSWGKHAVRNRDGGSSPGRCLFRSFATLTKTITMKERGGRFARKVDRKRDVG